MSNTPVTAVIFWEIPEDIKYFVIEGDITEFNGIYINSYKENEDPKIEAIRERMVNFFYDNKTGQDNFHPTNITDIELAVRNQNAKLIQCGIMM